LDECTVLVRSEQGIGDEIMFASCLSDLLAMAKHCVVECSRRLAPLFRRSFPQATIVERNMSAAPVWDALPHIDFQIMAGSLPRYFRRHARDFPGRSYLRPDPAAVAQWKRRFEGKRRPVGIAWSGGLPATLGAARSLRLTQLELLLRSPGLRFIALELYDRREELAALENAYGLHIESLNGIGADLDDLAAAVAALDLVISVPTTLAHVGGAVGTTVWVLAPRVATWRYRSRGDAMPWYNSVRIFRRPEGEAGMDAFIARVCTALDVWRAAGQTIQGE
jgi:hypothetical protein